MQGFCQLGGVQLIHATQFAYAYYFARVTRHPYRHFLAGHLGKPEKQAEMLTDFGK
jgi:hypothetical protein